MTKKIDNKYFTQLTDVYAVHNNELYKNFLYVNFEDGKKKHSGNNLTEDEKNLLLTFKNRLENLKNIIKKINLFQYLLLKLNLMDCQIRIYFW